MNKNNYFFNCLCGKNDFKVNMYDEYVMCSYCKKKWKVIDGKLHIKENGINWTKLSEYKGDMK